MQFRRLLLLTLGMTGTTGCANDSQKSDSVPTTDSAKPEDTHDSGVQDSSPDSGPLPAFVLEVKTALDGPHLLFQSNLPPNVEDCAELPVQDPPCSDIDEDGLVDLWEDQALDRLRPILQFDESEPLLEDSTAVLHGVGRIAPASDNSSRIRLFLMIGFSQDYGRCGVNLRTYS